MWQCWFAFAISLLFQVSPTTAHATQLVTRDLNAYDGYRCGRRVFTRAFLEYSADQAADVYFKHLALFESNIAPNFPFRHRTYTGSYDFGTGTSKPIKWPFSQTVTETTTAYYSLVLDIEDGASFRVVGVIRSRDGNDLKCVREIDFSDVSGHDLALGYRCPLNIYTFSMIESVLGISLEDEETGKRLMNVASFSYLVNGRPLFDDSEDLISRTVTPEGKLQNTALGLIIMNKHYQFMGMAYKNRDVYLRCKLTAHARIEPKFIGFALQQEPKRVDLESVDVFQCSRHFLPATEVLRTVRDARDAFLKRKQSSQTVYPCPHTPFYMGGSETLYRWPIRRFFRGTSLNLAHDVKNEMYYALIDDFSNVERVMQRMFAEPDKPCQRKLVGKKMLADSLQLKLRKSPFKIF